MSRLVLVHHAIHAQPHATHPHRTVGVPIHDLFGRQDHRGRSVALRGAVVEPEGLDHDGGGQRLLDGDLVPQLRLGILQRVEVILHRHHRHVLLGRGDSCR